MGHRIRTNNQRPRVEGLFYGILFSKKTVYFLSFLTFLCLLNIKALAHEIRPAYLEIIQTQDDQYEVIWKVPMKGNTYPQISPLFPSNFIVKEEQEEVLPTALLKKYTAQFSADIHGKNISIQGIERTLIDVLVQVKLLDRTSYTVLLQPDRAKWMIPFEPNSWQILWTYLELGFTHILAGIDHLLFVLGLLLIVSGLKNLIKTITAFTVAHSITLSLSILDWVSLAQAPVEAVIALSIVLLAKEYLNLQTGKSSWTIEYPWLVAFVFGLLHGFGFAGALQEVGLPQVDIPLALLMFNVGVEVGQLCFIGLVFFGLFFYKKMKFPISDFFPKIIAYGMGTIATFWWIERILEFW